MLKTVFNLYVVGFDEEALSNLKEIPGTYFREFRKAYYQMMFDKKWADEVLDIENQHVMSTAIILLVAPQIPRESFMSINPVDEKKPDYGCEYELPTEMNGISQATKDMIKHHYTLSIANSLALNSYHTAFMQILGINPANK